MVQPELTDDEGMTWWDVRLSLCRAVSLRDDWDGLGADAPKLAIIQKATQLQAALRDAGILPPPSRVGACPMGGIIFEWQFTNGGYLDVEITPAETIEWMEERKGQPTRHGTGTPDGKIKWKENHER